MNRHQISLGQIHDASALSVQDATESITDLLVRSGVTDEAARGQVMGVLWSHLRELAQVAAYQDTFLVLCGVTLLALLPALLSRARISSNP